jgi:hypothetical protein
MPAASLMNSIIEAHRRTTNRRRSCKRSPSLRAYPRCATSWRPESRPRRLNRGNPLARVDMFSGSGHVSSRKGRGGKDGKRAKRTSACWYEGTTRWISSIEAQALGTMRAQASKHSSCSVYPSRRRLRGSLPVVRDDRSRKGLRRRCAACTVGTERTRRAITLTRGTGCLSTHSAAEKRSSWQFLTRGIRLGASREGRAL